jgi:SAM-dependent methyltransferase
MVTTRTTPGFGPCRGCSAPLRHSLVDLGLQPLADDFPTAGELAGEESFPLHVLVCDQCWLVQVRPFEGDARILAEHTHAASSYSDTLVAHAKAWVAEMLERCPLPGRTSASPSARVPFVVDMASNDGYLLANLVDRGIDVLGFEHAPSNVEAARARGVTTEQTQFGLTAARKLAAEGRRADLLIGNHSLANAGDLGEMAEAMKTVLAPGGRIALEFHHVRELVAEAQFDVISHAHCLYLSLLSLEPALTKAGLVLIDAEMVAIHGGSVRAYAAHAEEQPPVGPGVKAVLEAERAAGMDSLVTYESFGSGVEQIRDELVAFLERVRADGSSIAGYGAPSKGNTLLNSARVTPDLLPWTVDRSPAKHGRFMAGSHIPIHAPERIFEARPDYVLILPWSLAEEITSQLAEVRAWGGRFVTAFPRLTIWS